MISRQIDGSNNVAISLYRHFSIIPYHDNWILTEPSSDTVYRLSPDYNIIPFIARTPSIQSMEPEIFLFPRMETDCYYFMETAKKEVREFAKTELVYDKQEKAIFRYILSNRDFSNKSKVEIGAPINQEIAFCSILESYQLIESYEKGELKGRLKEIAMTLNAESNPVIMLVKHKK
jgi:hypothetical protein